MGKWNHINTDGNLTDAQIELIEGEALEEERDIRAAEDADRTTFEAQQVAEKRAATDASFDASVYEFLQVSPCGHKQLIATFPPTVELGVVKAAVRGMLEAITDNDLVGCQYSCVRNSISNQEFELRYIRDGKVSMTSPWYSDRKRKVYRV